MAIEKGTLIGQGRTAEIFLWKDDQVLKLFLVGFPPQWVEHEARVTRMVHEAGLPVPVVEGIVEVEDRLGIVFERIEGSSMLENFLSKPWEIIRLTRVLAELHTAVHSCEVSGLPSQRERLESRIRDMVVLPANTKEAVLKTLAQLPDGSTVCHGDFHPDNIIMSSRGPIIIDWIDATQGNPLADVTRTLLLGQAELLPHIRRQWLIKSARRLFLSIYLRSYLQLRNVSREEIAAWQLPVAAARLREDIPGEKDRLLALIEASLPLR